MMTINNLTDLLMKHLQGNLTEPEQEQLDHWVSQRERNRRLFDAINDEEQLRQQILLYHQEAADNNEAIILSKIRQQMSSPAAPVRKLHSLRRWGTVAAIALLVAGMGGYLLLNRKKDTSPAVTSITPTDIPPARDGAILTLADGTVIDLEKAANGEIAIEGKTAVIKEDGRLEYQGAHSPLTTAHSLSYNTLTTPRGRQFQLTLPDGTKAWLNAASSLYYPTVFSGNERRVQITGEVYFEVTHDKAKPFIVSVNDQAQIQVLGTKFNVNAYANETAIKATLLEGSVKVVNGQWSMGNKQPDNYQEAILKPGEQVSISHQSQLSQPIPVQTDKAIAWKRGYFNFEDASLQEVMRQLERWYDIDVVYEKGVPDIQFGGKMSNDVTLSGLLKSLQEMEVHFRVEGRKLIVLP